MIDSGFIKLLWKKVRLPIFLFVGSLLFGVIGYKAIYPEVPFSKIIFMTGITLSTVGYGDVLNVEANPLALYFTMVLMVIGMGAVLYAISNVTAFIVEGNIRNIFAIASTKRKAMKMKDHYVICGTGKTGIHVVREMVQTKQQFIVIEKDQDRIDVIREISPDCLVFQGDATDDTMFEKVNLKEAKGLVATLSNDKDNLYLCLSAKLYNPTIEIVARAFEMNMYEKFKKAGAKYIVSPNFIGGMRIASEILRPHVVTFLDKMLKAKDKSIRVEESTIPASSPLIGKTIREIKFQEETGVGILACSQDGISFDYNPSLEHEFKQGDIILYICNNEQRKDIEKFISNDNSFGLNL